MSKDIRSYFQQKKPQKPKIEDDEDVIPESPDVHIKNKKKDAKKRRVLDDDSDEEIFATKKNKRSTETVTSRKNKEKPKPILKEVKAVDMFGSAPIKRSEPLVKKEKKKETELGIHSDEELEKTLLEIDNAELELDQPNVKSPSKSHKTDDGKPNDKGENYENTTPESVKPSSSKNTTKESNKTINDVSTDKRPRHSKDSESKSSKQRLDDDKTDKKIHKSVSIESSDGEKKTKMDNNKRKFAEFIENDSNHEHGSGKKKKLNESHESESHNGTNKHFRDSNSSLNEDEDKEKKNNHNKSLNESVLTDEERHERRRHSAALYKNYLNRSGPKNLGAKEIPEGSPDCFKDCAFILTGVLDSFEKEEITAAIIKFGGSVKSGVTKKVTHVLAGEEPGPAKIAKAEELGIKIISEDEFLKMIIDLSKKKSNKDENKKDIKKEKSPNKKSSKESLSTKTSSDKSEKDKKMHSKTSLHNKSSKDNHVESKSKKSPSSEKEKSDPKSQKDSKLKFSTSDHKHHDKSKSPKKIKEESKLESKSFVKSEEVPGPSKPINGISNAEIENKGNTSMWVEKYKPQNLKQIIGQHGDASNVKKLINWLTKWYVNRKAKLIKPSPWAKNDDGGYFKAALLSGPPGVGKTTTVSLVCKELGFDVVEFNASDTRNKTLIKEQIGELLTTTSLSAYAKGDTGKQAVTKKHVLVMDEVDGMAGNEDRGGLQELISLIKSTSVPIICMCNDRNSQKMRSLVNYCYDLRFSRPRVDQIKSAMLSICFKEGIKIPPDALAQLILSANQDVRQTLNLLSMWAIEPNLADADRLRKDAKTVTKDVKLGPWDAIRKVFSAEDHKTMTINDKSDLFFYDYSLAPLFVQENYLQVEPHFPKDEKLQRISDAADSISLGDLVDARIRRNQAWSLLPLQAMYSSVIPGHRLSGHVAGQIQFPGWLGKNSRASKMHRLCQEIHAHTRLSTSGSKSSIFLDYSTHLRDAIVTPLIKDKAEGITKSLEVLEAYHLLREDLDSLVELSVWPGQRNPTILIDSKVKAAMTRTYNKKATALPYAPGAVKKGRAKEDSDELAEEQEGDQEEPEDSDPENDALIKKKKSTKDTEKPSSSKSEKSSSKPSTSKKKKEK